MECKDCERCPTCEFMIDATTVVEANHGQTHYIKGEGCPKDWIDKPVAKMTDEQKNEAIKALRMSFAESHVDTKPPLGCKPAFVSSQERIIELSEAITRNAKDTCNEYLIKKWATEILYQCEIMTKC